MENFPQFKSEYQALSSDASTKTTEQLSNLLLEFGEEFMKLFSSPSTPPASSVPTTPLADSETKKSDPVSDLQWAKMTLRYKMSTFGANNSGRPRRRESSNPFALTSSSSEQHLEEDNGEGEMERKLLQTVAPFAESVMELVIFAYESMYDARKDKDSKMLEVRNVVVLFFVVTFFL